MEISIEVNKIKEKLSAGGSFVKIPFLRGQNTFTAILGDNGIKVSNLDSEKQAIDIKTFKTRFINLHYEDVFGLPDEAKIKYAKKLIQSFEMEQKNRQHN